MNNSFYKIKWVSTQPIKDNLDYENFIHKYELCMEYTKKYKTKNDIILAKYNPKNIIKYPININKEDTLSNGTIAINTNDFKYTITKNDLIDSYITETTYYKNGISKVKKIKINTTCMYNECNLISNLINYKKLYLKLDISCTNKKNKCNFAIISTNKFN